MSSAGMGLGMAALPTWGPTLVTRYWHDPVGLLTFDDVADLDVGEVRHG